MRASVPSFHESHRTRVIVQESSIDQGRTDEENTPIHATFKLISPHPAWLLKMRLFSRKSGKVSTNGDSATTRNGSLSSKSSLKSTPIPKNGNGSTFTSPSLPDITLPAPPDPKVDPAAYLRSIYAVRERSRYVYNKAKRNQLNHFTVDLTKFNETASYVVSIINVSQHGRTDESRESSG